MAPKPGDAAPGGPNPTPAPAEAPTRSRRPRDTGDPRRPRRPRRQGSTTPRRGRRRAPAALAVVLAAVLAATGLSGCASGRDPHTYTVLDYYTDEPGHSNWTKRLNACGARIGVKIRHQSVPGPQLVPKILQLASSRTMPDVLMIDNPDLQQIASTHALVPLTDNGVDTQGYSSQILAAGSYHGKVYGLAPTVNSLALYYNKDILAKAGVTPPRTWEELAASAKKLTGGGRYGVAFSAPATYTGAWQFLPYLWSSGGELTKLDSPQIISALTAWAGLVKSGSASRSVVNWEQDVVADQFAAGKAAMAVDGPWIIPQLDLNKKLRWGIVQVPVPKLGDTSYAPLGGEVFTTPVTTREREPVAAKIVSCITSPANQLQAAKQDQKVPARLSTAQTFRAQDARMAPFVDIAAKARARTADLGTRWPAAAQALEDAIQQALTGSATPAAALHRAQAAMKKGGGQ